MVCQKCGTQLGKEDRFCPNCGAPTKGESGPGFGDSLIIGEDEQTWILPPEEWAQDQGGSWGPDMAAANDDSDDSDWSDWDDSPSPETVSGPPGDGRRIDPSERHELVMLTGAEAASGCEKVVEIEDQELTIRIPPGTRERDTMTIPGHGYVDQTTGERGVLKIQFLID